MGAIINREPLRVVGGDEVRILVIRKTKTKFAEENPS
jgi:hypothetical protein